MNQYKVKLTLIHPILGTVPKNPDLYAERIAPDTLTEEELAAELQSVEDGPRGETGFHKMPDGSPFLMAYVVKGFFKDACGMLRRDKSTRSSKLTAYKKVIDGLVFIEPDEILLNINGGQMDSLERPLRASTAQGERIALSRSDTCPPGTSLEITILTMGDVSEELLREWLDYGRLRGLGQWRNAGYGRFTYEMEVA